jgi:hypothetical protein
MSQSFPRKRESTPKTFGNALSTDWIPAFAGMTCDSKGIPFQMTPAPRLEVVAGVAILQSLACFLCRPCCVLLTACQPSTAVYSALLEGLLGNRPGLPGGATPHPPHRIYLDILGTNI